MRSVIPKGKTKNALEWTITPNVVKDWKYTPTIHVSQVGYHISSMYGAIDINNEGEVVLLNDHI